jgi:hypothetical protein
MRHTVARAALGVGDLFLGATALYGGIAVVPTLPPEWRQGTPFSDWTLPAVALTSVGAVALAGAVGLLVRPSFGLAASALAAAAIAAFETIQVLTISLGNWLAPLGITFGNRVNVEGGGIHPALWLQPFYFALGVGMLVLSWRVWRETGSRSEVTAGRTARLGPQLAAG